MDSNQYVGKEVIVEGKTGQVCQASGCWLLLTDSDNNQLYVQFYDFTVRLGTGIKLRVQGELCTQNKVPYLVADGPEVVKLLRVGVPGGIMLRGPPTGRGA